MVTYFLRTRTSSFQRPQFTFCYYCKQQKATYLKWWGMPCRTSSLTKSLRFFHWLSQSATMLPHNVQMFSSPVSPGAPLPGFVLRRAAAAEPEEEASPPPPFALQPDCRDTCEVSEPLRLWLLCSELSDFASDSISLWKKEKECDFGWVLFEIIWRKINR